MVCAQEWHCKDIQSHIHSHPLIQMKMTRSLSGWKVNPRGTRRMHTCTLLKQRAKPSTQQIRRLRLVVIFLSTLVANRHCSPLSFTRPLPVQCSGGRRPGTFAFASRDCSTSEAFSPRTVLTENICGYVQQILRHQPTTMPFLTTPAVILSCLASAAAQLDSW